MDVENLILNEQDGTLPWENEPERLEFRYKGYPCLIQRVRSPSMPLSSGHLCGYAGVNESHPYHGKSYDDVNLEMHECVNYSSNTRLSELSDEHNLWWFGFDCANISTANYNQYRTIGFVQSEIENLVDQLEEVRKRIAESRWERAADRAEKITPFQIGIENIFKNHDLEIGEGLDILFGTVASCCYRMITKHNKSEADTRKFLHEMLDSHLDSMSKAHELMKKMGVKNDLE